jgi:sucrose-6-phosphate hydrolase SacC (GH32 family)
VADDAAPLRPHVHFTPPSGWMNDPNGLVHVDGVWHLFYQHHPASLAWGPMHWGHATSRDLTVWQHHPVAIEPDDLGTAFSGSAVVDVEGVAGFGAEALVAFYTHHREGQPQSQGVAASKDGGLTWTAHLGNPVLRAPEGLVDFRDPKVLRFDDHWVMVVVGGPEVVFHRSDDLLTWSECGRFGRAHGAHGGLWETPDLFELEVEGTGERRWVLVVSVLAGGPAVGTGTQYFVGTFDGATFTCDGPAEEVRWVDHGADFYAPQSWYAAPGGRRVWLAWMGNWAYAETPPASTWRGAMTVPRDVALAPDATGRPVLVQRPSPEVLARGAVVAEERGVTVTPAAPWTVDAAPEAFALHLQLRPGDATAAVEVHRGDGVGTRIGYDGAARTLTVLRDDRGLLGVDPPGGQVVPVPLHDGEVELHVLVDTCSVEVFTAGGRVVLTDQVFPAPEARGVAVTAQDGPVHVAELSLRDLTRPRVSRA